MEEYKLLRAELLNHQNIRQAAVSILYTGVSAILALGVSREYPTPIIFLLAFCVIIPTYFLVMGVSSAILRIGAYLQVFHENSEFMWETRFSEFSSDRAWRYKYMLSFYILSLVSLILFALHFDRSICISGSRIVELVIASILLILTVTAMVYHRNISKMKADYVLAWKRVAINEKEVPNKENQ